MKVSIEKILIDIFWEEKTLSYGKFTMLIRKKSPAGCIYVARTFTCSA